MRLLIAGRVHEQWERYDVDSDLLVPADAWHCTIASPDGVWPAGVTPGAPVEVRMGAEPVMVGRIDEISHQVDKRGHVYHLSGRDGAAALVDCSAPLFTRRQATLSDFIPALVRAMGITRHRVDAAESRRREKISVEPGDTAWDALVHVAEANGLWPWFDPDGTLVVGGPKYDAPEQATLILARPNVPTSAHLTNVESLELRRSIAERYSELTVLGQTHGTELETGKHNIGVKVQDPEMVALGVHRPKIVVDHESDSPSVARARARKLLADARMAGTTLTARVQGHVIDAPGMPGHGKLWQPGMRLRVVSAPHGIDATWFLMGRRFSGGRDQGAVTELRLKEDRVWLLDAHPHKRKHRRGKNAVDADAVVDGGAL